MARDLTALQKQYNSAATEKRNAFRPRGGPRGGRGVQGATGKPKNTKKTLGRLIAYMKPYTGRLIIVMFCMLISTVTSLVGSYLLAPIVNRVAAIVSPDMVKKLSFTEQFADNIIDALTKVFPFQQEAEILTYILSAIFILACIYLVGVITTYLQAKLMLTTSQGIIEKIRNDLFIKLQELPVRYFDSNPTGEVMSRFTNDIDNIDMMLNNSLSHSSERSYS